jgi:flagellar export protein FliJ
VGGETVSKNFRFRLERVLEVRRASEEAAHRDLAVARKSVSERETRVGSLARDRERAGEDRKSMLGGRVDPGRLALAAAFEASLERTFKTEENGLRIVSETAERRRAALVAAAQRVRVLERLEERRRVAWTEGRNREEQKAADDRAPRPETP